MVNRKRQTMKRSRKNKTNTKTRGYHSKRRMKGGTSFSEENKSALINYGFTERQINFLELKKMTNMNIIRISLQQINPNTNAAFTPSEIIEDLNNLEDTDNEGSDTDVDDIASGKRTRKNKTQSKLKTKGRYTKRRKHIRKKQKKHHSRTRNQTGGMCYGNGVGTNTNNPNLSIFNTDLLKLFPYSPSN